MPLQHETPGFHRHSPGSLGQSNLEKPLGIALRGWFLFITLLAPVIAGATDFYTSSNDSINNELIRFRVDENGLVRETGRFSTGGRGTGANLPSAGSIALSPDRRWLVVVNAGSNQISSFRLGPQGPRLTGIQDSKGELPLSIAFRGHVVYVLNGGSRTVASFRLKNHGTMEPFEDDAIRPLSSPEARATSLAVSQDGHQLIVAERSVNRLTRYVIDQRGRLEKIPQVTETSAASPFALSFSRNTLYTVFAGQGSKQSAVGSYRDEPSKGLTPRQVPIPTGQTAACWSALSAPRRLLFIANAGSHSLTGVQLTTGGSLRLLDPDGVSADTGSNTRPRDLAISRDGKSLAVILDGVGEMAIYSVGEHGGLTQIGTGSGVPAGASGLITP